MYVCNWIPYLSNPHSLYTTNLLMLSYCSKQEDVTSNYLERSWPEDSQMKLNKKLYDVRRAHITKIKDLPLQQLSERDPLSFASFTKHNMWQQVWCNLQEKPVY